jgi:predicted amidohydrolase
VQRSAAYSLLSSPFLLNQCSYRSDTQALFLPEASDYISHNPAETISLVKTVEESEYVVGLQKEAREHKIAITAGIHEPGLESSKKIRNTAIWISEEGEIIHRYQKVHLFDMDIKDGPQARESE